MKWRRQFLLVVVLSFLFLIGCEIDISFNDKDNEDESAEIENAGTDENGNRENENIQNEEADNQKVTEESEEVDSEKEENDQTEDAETFNQEQGDIEPSTVQNIMDISASLFITSMKLNAYVQANQTNIYQESPLVWDMEIYINQSSKITTHEQITMSDGRTEDVDVEVYAHPDVMFMDIANQGVWLESENTLGSYRHYYWIDSMIMHHFAQHANLFVGYDDDTHFRIEFVGTDEQFEEIIFYGFDSIVDDTLWQYFTSEGGDITGELVMRFEKEHFTLTDYTFSYEATTTVPDEGDYHVVEIGEYSFSEFGEHNSLTIPAFVYD